MVEFAQAQRSLHMHNGVLVSGSHLEQDATEINCGEPIDKSNDPPALGTPTNRWKMAVQKIVCMCICEMVFRMKKGGG